MFPKQIKFLNLRHSEINSGSFWDAFREWQGMRSYIQTLQEWLLQNPLCYARKYVERLIELRPNLLSRFLVINNAELQARERPDEQ